MPLFFEPLVNILSYWSRYTFVFLIVLLPAASAFAENQDNLKITMGILETNTRNATKEEIETAFPYMLKNLPKEKRVSTSIISFQSSEKMTAALKNNEIDGFFGSSLECLRNESLINPEYLYSIAVNDKIKPRFLLLVRKDSDISKIEDLKNKKLTYSLSDDVGLLYIEKLLRQNKMGSINNFFSLLVAKKFGALTTSAIFFKEVDAALVSESDFDIAAELNPQLNQQLTTIATSPEFIVNCISFRNKLPNQTYSRLRDILYSLGENASEYQLLNLFNATNVIKIKKDDLASVIELVNNHQKNP